MEFTRKNGKLVDYVHPVTSDLNSMDHGQNYPHYGTLILIRRETGHAIFVHNQSGLFYPMEEYKNLKHDPRGNYAGHSHRSEREDAPDEYFDYHEVYDLVGHRVTPLACNSLDGARKVVALAIQRATHS